MSIRIHELKGKPGAVGCGEQISNLLVRNDLDIVACSYGACQIPLLDEAGQLSFEVLTSCLLAVDTNPDVVDGLPPLRAAEFIGTPQKPDVQRKVNALLSYLAGCPENSQLIDFYYAVVPISQATPDGGLHTRTVSSVLVLYRANEEFDDRVDR